MVNLSIWIFLGKSWWTEESGRLPNAQTFEDVEGDKNGVQIMANGFQEPKEVPSDSPTIDECVLLIATWNC